MTTDVLTRNVLSRNITLVYDAVDPQLLNAESIRRLFGGSNAVFRSDSIFVGIADLLAVVEISNNRLLVTSRKASEKVDEVPVWEPIAALHALIRSTASSLRAFGFNFEIAITSANERSVDAALMRRFGGNLDHLAKELGGEPISMKVGFTFRRDAGIYTLTLEPRDVKHSMIMLNVHFEHGNADLPSVEVLRRLFVDALTHLESVIASLVEAVK